MTSAKGAPGRLEGWRAAVVWAVVGVEIAYVLASLALPERLDMPLFARLIFSAEVATFGIVGALVATRQPRNAVGWILWGVALAIALSIAGDDYATVSLDAASGALPGTTPVAWAAGLLFLPALVIVIVFVPLLFPDGRLLSPRWRWVAALGLLSVAAAVLPSAVMPGPLGSDPRIPNPLGIEALAPFGDVLTAANLLGIAIVLPLAIASIVLRFRRGDRVVREQLKWLVAAIGLTGACMAVAVLGIPGLSDLGWVASIVSISFIPIAIGIAILRYRLYEIDRIISRTLSYAVVTVTLALIFVAVVLGLQAVLEPVTGENTVAVAASTLVVAALFQPLRRRVQRVVDRRFNRARYDAQRLVDAFSDRLRDEVDIGTVTDDLDGTIRSALGPSTLGRWLREPAPGIR